MCLVGHYSNPERRVLITRAQTNLAYATARMRVKAARPRRTAAEIVRAGEAYRTDPRTNQPVPNPELVRCFRGVNARSRAITFLDDCRRDPALRSLAEQQGFDLDGFAESLANAEMEAHCYA